MLAGTAARTWRGVKFHDGAVGWTRRRQEAPGKLLFSEGFTAKKISRLCFSKGEISPVLVLSALTKGLGPNEEVGSIDFGLAIVLERITGYRDHSPQNLLELLLGLLEGIRYLTAMQRF